jgi:methionine aminopeptidase
MSLITHTFTLSFPTAAWQQLVPGQALTIEPVLMEAGATAAVKKWSDGWTMAVGDHSLSAQFEVTVIVREPKEGGGCEVVTPFLTEWEDEKAVE